jgi:L-malate glycosyltransferase
MRAYSQKFPDKQREKEKVRVMQGLAELSPGGAESLALTILTSGESRICGSVCALTRGSGALIPSMEEVGIPWYQLAKDVPSRWEVSRNLFHLLRHQQIDILHLQHCYLLSWFLPAARLAGVKVVYTEHAKHSLSRVPKLRFFVRLAAPILSAISVISQDLKQFMVEQVGLDAKRVEIIPNGVDLSRFGGRKDESTTGEYLLPPDWNRDEIFLFGNVARFCEAKDHPTLLKALNLVRQKHPQVRLILLGDGETREEIETNIRDMNLGGHVCLAGMRNDVPEQLSCMDAFVLSSKREGVPMSIIEAMAAGVPVVTTNVGGIGEAVRHGTTARMVPPENPEALAEAMIWLIEHNNERAAMTQTAMEVVQANFSHTAMVERYLKLYIGGRKV